MAGGGSSTEKTAKKMAGMNKGKRDPVFEMVVLGSGGGPLETDCSGYLIKPYVAKWEEGILALEGGSGLGALSSLLEVETRRKDMFPGINYPKDYDTPVLQAAYVFSFLTCYLITHAHLDHNLSLIMLSGSVPPRPSISEHAQPPLVPSPAGSVESSKQPKERNPAQSRIPVFGTKETLERLALAYGGGLWPELGHWARESGHDDNDTGTKRKRTKLEKSKPPTTDGCGVVLSPMAPSKVHRPLHPALPITTLVYPVAHGCTSRGLYESSAIFIRYDPAALEGDDNAKGGNEDGYREILFFGDVESEWRKPGEEDINKANREGAMTMNKAIWEEAARSWDQGTLAGVFIECSYDSHRPAHLMFGHISPPGLLHELDTLASMVKQGERPLEGLVIYVTHIKEALVPHSTGRTARQRIMAELRVLEAERRLGVSFVDIKRGDRILV